MRLWLKDSERRPDPKPVKTDDRKALVVGLAGWLVGLAILLTFSTTLTADGRGWWFTTCFIGLGLGLVALVYSIIAHRRSS